MNKNVKAYFCLTGLLAILAGGAVSTYANERLFQSNLPECKKPTNFFTAIGAYDGYHECYGTKKLEHAVMEGVWHEGNLIKGRIDYEGGFSYREGNFVVNRIGVHLLQGQGTYSHDNGQLYEKGIFERNILVSGVQKVTYNPSWHVLGSAYHKYQGDIENKVFHGQGDLIYRNGNSYSGFFEDGKPHGDGEFKYSNGKAFTGVFKNGLFWDGVGTIQYTNPDGTYTGVIYTGKIENGSPEGQGKMIYPDGTVDIGLFKNGKIVSNNDPGSNASGTDRQVIQISSGTGFAITYDGHIVTNNHVISGCRKILLVNDGKYVPLKVLANDPLNDLAVLKGDFTPSETFAIGKGNPELMQDIYVSGYPFGKKVSTSVKVTRGIISSLTGYGNNFSGIQIDAAVQPGNSGGPIFDDNGNVVGVVVSKLAKQGDITPENTNFGVKANILANILVSNSVPFTEGGKSDISKSKLSAKASDATFYLSCWNTVAEAQKMRTKKVMFSELD